MSTNMSMNMSMSTSTSTNTDQIRRRKRQPQPRPLQHCNWCEIDQPFEYHKTRSHKHGGKEKQPRRAFIDCPGPGCPRCLAYAEQLSLKEAKKGEKYVAPSRVYVPCGNCGQLKQ